MKKSHMVDLTIDGKTLKTEAQDLLLKVDDLPVYRFPHFVRKNSRLQTSSLRFLLRSADAAFGHTHRYEIVRSLVDSAKTFSEIKEKFDMPSSTLDFHLRKLTTSWVVYKKRDGTYATTLLGDLLLNYFSKFLDEADKLQKSLSADNDLAKRDNG